MRVLHVIPRLAVQCGGPVTAVLGMTSALRGAGIDVRLITTDHWSEGIPDKIDCETKIFPASLGSWQWSRELGLALPQEVDDADIVNIHTLWSYPVVATARACRKRGVPYVLRTCGMLDAWSLAQKRWKKRLYVSLVEHKTINGASFLWFTSEKERAGTQQFGYSCPDAVLPLGILKQTYESLPLAGAFRSSRAELKDGRIILYMGRLTRRKRPDLLLRAFAKIFNEFQDAKLVIAGPDEHSYTKELDELAERLGIRSRTHFIGTLREQEIQEILVDAEVFVSPSSHENFGMSVLEAMACGTPVIVSNSVMIADEIRRVEAGVVARPDEESLASELRNLLSNPSLAREMGRRGRELAMERFTWETIVPSLVKLYERAIDEKKRAGRNGTRP